MTAVTPVAEDVLAFDLEPDGQGAWPRFDAGAHIDVEIAPGLVTTDFARALYEDPQKRAAREAATPLRRLGVPDDIAGLAADEALTAVIKDGRVVSPAIA